MTLNEDLFRLLEYAPAFVYIFDRDLRIKYLNKAARDRGYGGASMEALLGKTSVDLGMDPATWAVLAANDRHVMDSGEPFQDTERLLGGVMLSLKWPLCDAGGEIIGVGGIGIDVSKMAARTQADMDWLARQVHSSTDIVEALAEGVSKLALLSQDSPFSKRG